MFRSIAITFIALISAWPSSPSQVYDQESAIQLDQLSFSISDLPMILNLAQTFSNASLGVPSDAFQRWVNEHPLDSSMETLRELVLKFQSAVKVHSNWLNQTISQNNTFPYFLSESLKFAILAPNPFQQSLHECAVQQGYIPYGMHLLHNAIDHKYIPSRIYISKKPIFRSVPSSQWQQSITNNSEQCSIWQINQITLQAEVKAALDCNQKIHSICIQSVGTETHSNRTEFQASQQMLLASSEHLYYLITQLSSYPSPHERFASDISIHLTEAFATFAESIEKRPDFSYRSLFAFKRCTELLQLALQKAQHSESWKAEERQQSNFEAIQSLVNNHSIFLKNIASRVQILETNRHQYRRRAQGDFLDDQSQQQGSGMSSPSHPDSVGIDEDDDEYDPRDASNSTINVSNSFSNASNSTMNVSNSFSNASNSTINVSNSPSNASDSTIYASNSTMNASNPNFNASNSNFQDDNANPTNGSDASAPAWSPASWFTWEYWLPQAQNSTEPAQDNQLQLFDSSGNGSFPQNIYSNLELVKFWPFPKLLTLAAFHLFNIIEFYVNLLWKILTILLAVYVYVLDQKISRLEQRFNDLNRTIEPKLDPSKVKELSSLQAQGGRSKHQPCSPPDLPCAQPLLPAKR